MKKTATIHARIEPRTKKNAEDILKRLGISPTEAIRLYYRQICLRDGIPFPVLLPNEVTASTLDKSKQGHGVQHFDSLDDMFESWDT